MKFLINTVFNYPIYFLAILLSYICITLTPVFITNHFFYNLEPYPDTFTYVMPPYNLARGGEYALQYKDTALKPNLVSSYSIALLVGFVSWNDPRVILLINCFLGVLSLVFLFKILSFFKFSHGVKITALVAYLLHGLFLWLPGLALTENVVLPSLLGAVLAALNVTKAGKIKHLVWLVCSVAVLFFARKSAIPVAVSIVLVTLVYGYVTKQTKRNVLLLVSLIVLLGIEAALNSWIHLSSSEVMLSLTSTSHLNTFYSFAFILKNASFYLLSLLGKSSTLLWLQQPLSSLFLFILALTGMYKLAKQKKWFTISVLLIPLLASLLAPLVFYHQDIRYAVVVVPMMIILSCFAVEATYKNKTAAILVSGIFIVSIFLSQAQFLKLIAGQNILLNTRAWQYESVQAIDEVVPTNGFIITALPAYLFELYHPQATYEVLPLSRHQEYISKGRAVWNQEINSDALLEQYQSSLTANDIYITNAYITHQQSVVDDYEQYKENFTLELVKEGCLSACNIYKLQPKTH